MSMRVATVALNETMMRAALRVQAQEAEATLQQASGLVSTSLSGYGASAGRIVDLQSSLSRAAAYESAATEADTRVEVMYTAVGSMIDAMTDFKADLANFSTTLTDSGRAGLAAEAQSVLETMASLLDTDFEGRYLFSGSATATAPIDLDAITAHAAPSTADTSWYAGDDTLAATRVDDDRTVTWGATASEEGFEKAIRALAMLAAGNTEDADLEEAATLVGEAIDAMTTTRSRLSLAAGTLEAVASDQEDYQSFVSGLLTDTTSVDVAEVSVRLTTLQTQLQATYSAIGTIQNLSLSDYLK